MRLRFAFLSAAGVLLIAASSTYAFDGRRTGFVLGFGTGPGLTSFTQTLRAPGFPDVTSDRENKFAVATDFKIGGGINEQFLLYYINRMSWFSIENVLREDVIIGNSVGLLGASYYFQNLSPSPYVLGLIGLASWDAPFESGSDAQIGFGIGAGIGWEFSPHWSVEATLNWGLPGDEAAGLEVETNALSFLVTVNALAY